MKRSLRESCMYLDQTLTLCKNIFPWSCKFSTKCLHQPALGSRRKALITPYMLSLRYCSTTNKKNSLEIPWCNSRSQSGRSSLLQSESQKMWLMMKIQKWRELSNSLNTSWDAFAMDSFLSSKVYSPLFSKHTENTPSALTSTCSKYLSQSFTKTILSSIISEHFIKASVKSPTHIWRKNRTFKTTSSWLMISLEWTNGSSSTILRLFSKVESFRHWFKLASTCLTWLMSRKYQNQHISFLRRCSWCIGVMISFRSTMQTNMETGSKRIPKIENSINN